AMGIVGYFNNILPIRIDLSGNPSFRTLLKRVGLAAKEAFDNQDVPFQQIAALPNRARTPLTRCLFSVQNTLGLVLRLPGIVSSYQDVHNGAANFDLSIFFEEKDDVLAGIIDYKTDVFSETMIDRLTAQFQVCLQILVGHPEVPLSDLPNLH